MQRKVFDLIASAGGAVMVIVLVVAGVLLMWGYTFANSNVHTQLAEQQIVFPAKAAFAHPVAGSEITPSMIPRIVTVSAAIAISGIAMRQYRTQRAAPMRTMTTIPALSWGCGGWIGMETPGTFAFVMSCHHRLVRSRQPELAWPPLSYPLSGRVGQRV